MDQDGRVDADALYDQFPRGADNGYGPNEGFNRWVRLNDPQLFTEAARNDPVIKEFLKAPFTVNYSQFKSSMRETEYFIHQPVRSMTGGVDGIEGQIENVPAEPRISTLVVN